MSEVTIIPALVVVMLVSMVVVRTLRKRFDKQMDEQSESAKWKMSKNLKIAYFGAFIFFWIAAAGGLLALPEGVTGLSVGALLVICAAGNGELVVLYRLYKEAGVKE